MCFRLGPLRDLASGGRHLKIPLTIPTVHSFKYAILSFRDYWVPFRAACCTFTAIFGLSAFDSLDHNFPSHSIGLSVVTHTVIFYIFVCSRQSGIICLSQATLQLSIFGFLCRANELPRPLEALT